jgi:hypothetical protein
LKKYQLLLVWQSAQRRSFAASIVQSSRSIHSNWGIWRDSMMKLFQRRIAMKTVRKMMVTAALVALGAVNDHGTLKAEEATQHLALKPVLGANAPAPARQSLLDLTLGAKQVVGYFNNEKGHCKVTIMVADAFDDAGVPGSPAVRFEVALDAGAKALMDTAAGRSLEFTCGEGAREMAVDAKAAAPVYASRT